MQKRIDIGHEYEDTITRFKGVATGYVEYISGCNQALLAPGLDTTGRMIDAAWFDVQRLRKVDAGRTVTLDNGDTPGCDAPAPIR